MGRLGRKTGRNNKGKNQRYAFHGKAFQGHPGTFAS
jgi:hypothetical protein